MLPIKASPGPLALAKFRDAARAEALRLGFSLAGFTSAEPLGDVVERRWARWLGEDKAGRMEYLRRAEPRRTHPRDHLPSAQSIIVVGASYYAGDHKASELVTDHCGKIARYAWGRDYHLVMRERLEGLGRWLETSAHEFGFDAIVEWRAFVDSAPLDERALAVRAGLGFIGKNTLLLSPRHGSWMLLGELLVSIPFPQDGPNESCDIEGPLASCGSCRKCLEACPTGALTGPYELDPRRCISYLTIEQRDPIPNDLGRQMSGWVFGCDICQEVCPFNAKPLPRLIEEFDPRHGIGKTIQKETLDQYPSNKAFARKWINSPVLRAGLRGMRNNFVAASPAEVPADAK